MPEPVADPSRMGAARGVWARLTGRGDRHDADLSDESRATGTAREVVDISPVVTGREPLHHLALPTDQRSLHGRLVHLSLEGPGLLRPGDRGDPVPLPLRGVAELTVLLQGSLEHRDTLGNRGQMPAPAVRLVSAGSGVTSELGESRELRRDGGDLEVLRLRWLQPGPPVVPTVRLAALAAPARQGRSRVRHLLGPDGPVQDPGGTTVVSVSVAAGATVDLAMADRWPAVVLVRRGTALIGDQLTPVVGPALAALTDVGQRLGVATHLSDDAGADLVVVTTRPLDHAVVHREGLVAAGTAEELDAVLDEARATGFGALPRLDG